VSERALRVLIVDDQPAVVQALSVLLELNEIEHVMASAPQAALAIADAEPLAVVVQDMNFARSKTSGPEGVELFHALRQAQPGLPILLITAWASLETAVELVREGAADYIQKPWDDDKLVATIRNLARLRQLDLENRALREQLQASRAELAAENDLCGQIYESEAMHRLVTLAVGIAKSDAPVLLTGPSGAGKEGLARIVQANSRRKQAAFVKVNVGAIPEELIESELFGAEAGAFTGARQRRIGHFETAHGGTLFLDEIDALSPAGQVKLLRVLQSGEFQRLGSSKTIAVDVRVLSASNAQLDESLAAGRFREDLYFRLNVVELRVPPLSARPADILPLARHFLALFAADGQAGELSRGAELALVRYDWPGNVRELENRVRRASLLASGPRIEAEDLDLGARPADSAGPELSASQELQRQELLRLLAEADGVVAHAASELGISRQALYRRMDRLGIEIERRPRS
jgi:DNA-binding NtrC family response regulator